MHASDIVKCEDAHTRTWMELEGMYDYYVFVMQHVRMNNIFDFLLCCILIIIVLETYEHCNKKRMHDSIFPL